MANERWPSVANMCSYDDADTMRNHFARGMEFYHAAATDAELVDVQPACFASIPEFESQLQPS